jgi:hypothetical protein
MHTLRFGRKLSLPSTIAIKHQLRKLMADDQVKKAEVEAKAESTDIRQMNVSPKRRSGDLDFLLQGSACLHGQVSPNDAVARPLPPPSALET